MSIWHLVIDWFKKIYDFVGGAAILIAAIWLLSTLFDRSEEKEEYPKPTFIQPEKPTLIQPEKPTFILPKKPTFTQSRVPLPANGDIRRFAGRSPKAPLAIKTSRGTNYLVRVVREDTAEPIADVFIHGGQTVKFLVPIGIYKLKYAVGREWYGYQYYFGPQTSYHIADSLFHFQDQGHRVTGYTVTLYSVPHGNLSTHQIDPSQF